MAKGIKTGGGSRKGVPNKVTADIKKLAQDHGPDAINALVRIMLAEEQPPAARVSAAKELLDRGYGKSRESVDIDANVKTSGVPIIQIVRLADDDAG